MYKLLLLMLGLIKLFFVLCARYMTCDLDIANEKGAVICRCGFRQPRPQALPRKRHEQPKVSGSKVTIARAAAKVWGRGSLAQPDCYAPPRLLRTAVTA